MPLVVDAHKRAASTYLKGAVARMSAAIPVATSGCQGFAGRNITPPGTSLSHPMTRCLAYSSAYLCALQTLLCVKDKQ